ncbi:MAG: TldD/PmbA family protein [Clostridiales bacterium]|jgi:PmbA protein|nr:TldD/PmbA family protein [Clostridiales bacterium]
MDANEFKERLKEAAAGFGFESWEIYFGRDESFQVKVHEGEIQQYKNSKPLGLSFRGVYKGRMGYSFTELLDEESILPLLSNAAANSQIVESDDVERLYEGGDDYEEVKAYDPQLNEASVSEKIEWALAMERVALDEDSRVKATDYCAVGSGEGEVAIANSYGLNLSHKFNYMYAFIQVRVEENGVSKNGFETWHGRDFKAFSPEDLAKKAVSKGLSYLNASSVPSQAMPVLFDPETAGNLFSAFASVFYAERAQKGFSLLRGRQGQTIASELVTIHDDGACQQSLGSVPFDSEGVACRKKVIVNKGKLNTLLYNQKSAAKDGVKSTGNGFKRSYAGSIDTSITNFYMEPSNEPIQAEKFQKILLVKELMGLHSGANPVTGDFSLLVVNGFLLENGKISKPVEQITVAGNFYDLIMNIIAVGNDLRFDMPGASGAVGMPSVLVKELKISGEVQ